MRPGHNLVGMGEGENNDHEQTDHQLLKHLVVRQGPDGFFAALVATVNAHPEVSVNVTLMVGGAVVCGVVESGEAWFEAQRQALEATQPGMGPVFDGTIERYRELREWAASTSVDERTDDDRDRTIPTYVHLRDVDIWAPDGTRFGVLSDMRWRCRLVAVDGWMFGTLRENTS
jgi:hypothetical protein